MVSSVGSPLLWVTFTIGIISLLCVDLLLHRDSHGMRPREALRWSAFWIALALLFNLWIARRFGAERGIEFLTGYLIEKALSVDNLFVFLVLFSYFTVPLAYQHRVLFWGVLGALIMRAIFILAGAALLAKFEWIVFVFGGFLILTGIKLLTQRTEEVNPERNPALRIFRKLVPMVSTYEGAKFTVVKEGRRYATPLLLVLIVVESTDVVFAVDSIPAIFAVTRDPFIVYTSNIFAVLGLRALYFLLAGMMERFRYLKVGLALVLVFVGAKMLISEIYHVPVGVSLGVVGGLLLLSVLASSLLPSPTSKPMEESLK